MAIVDHDRITRSDARDHDLSIMFGYLIASIVFLLVLYWAALSPGTAPGDLASMNIFP